MKVGLPQALVLAATLATLWAWFHVGADLRHHASPPRTLSGVEVLAYSHCYPPFVAVKDKVWALCELGSRAYARSMVRFDLTAERVDAAWPVPDMTRMKGFL